MTIEDPIEFLHRHKKCVVNQRELGSDATSFALALKAALRQDPDVILVGEMRDLETIGTALTAAETGHLVFATLHTQDTRADDRPHHRRLPAHQQGQVRVQLSVALQGIMTQPLLPTADGSGRAVADRGPRPDARGAQPDPRGQDPPDLLGHPDGLATACRRWTRRWRRSSVRADHPQPRRTPRTPRRSSAGCSGRVLAAGAGRLDRATCTSSRRWTSPASKRRARWRPTPSRRSPTSSSSAG